MRLIRRHIIAITVLALVFSVTTPAYAIKTKQKDQYLNMLTSYEANTRLRALVFIEQAVTNDKDIQTGRCDKNCEALLMPIILQLGHEDENVAVKAASVLGNMKESAEPAVKNLIYVINNKPSEALRQTAAYALYKIGDKDGLKALAEHKDLHDYAVKLERYRTTGEHPELAQRLEEVKKARKRARF